MFFKRQFTPEIMDDFSISDKRIDKALKELNIINRFLGGNSSSIKGIEIIKKKVCGKQLIKVLDIGAGGANLSNILNSDEYINYLITNVDLNIRTCKYSKIEYPELDVVCSNAFALPFKENSVDIIHVSLFLHHFTNEEILTLLNSFLSIAEYSIVINDLQRSVFALAGIKLLTMLFSKSEFVKSDAPLSVKRGFKKSELLLILNKLNTSGFTILCRWAFRWLIIINKKI